MATHVFRLRQNLAAILRHRAMTASELSRQTGVAKQVLSNWRAGVQPRKLEHLYSVAQQLGVSIETLCFATNENELTANINQTLKQTQPVSNPSGGGPGMDFPELKGTFEVYLRRINDE